MYKCATHGKLDSNWCDQCEKTVACDCSDKEATRFYPSFDCAEGEKTVRIWIHHCATCGDVRRVEF